MVCFDQVSKFILSDITLHIPGGRTVGFVGASGAGKTTFLKLACGLLLPDAGKIYIMGNEPADRKRQDCCSLGVLFADKPLLDKEDSVWGNFEMLKAIYRLPYEEFRRDYGELSQRLGFGEFEKESVKNLSLGQKRRAELGAALLHRPQLLILDEPLAGLDENAKWGFQALLAERKKAGHMTVMVATHNMAEVSGLCDRIALLHQGKLLFYGDGERLRKSFFPLEELVLKVSDGVPDLEDLPLERYCFDGEELKMVYRNDCVTAAEILQIILRKCSVTQVSMSRPELTRMVAELTGRQTEFKRRGAETEMEIGSNG